jgi:hypothetical protein
VDKYIIFHVEGGIGKNLMATAVATAIKKAHPDRKLIVTAPWGAVWFNHPTIDRFYILGQTPYFFEDFIKNKDTWIFKSEPYHHHDFLNGKRYLADIWCEQVGVPYNGELPVLVLSKNEKDNIARKLKGFGKPIFALQTNGGGPQDYPVSWVRDVPLSNIKDVINEVNKEYKIIHIRREDQLEIKGVDFIQTPNIRDLFALVDYSHNRLLIDSFAQHAAVALDRPSTVLWPIDNVKTLGYPDFHNNIVSTADTRKVQLIDSYLGTSPINGEFLHECPFDTDDIFDQDKISDSLDELEEKEFYATSEDRGVAKNKNVLQPQDQQPLPPGTGIMPPDAPRLQPAHNSNRQKKRKRRRK